MNKYKFNIAILYLLFLTSNCVLIFNRDSYIENSTESENQLPNKSELKCNIISTWNSYLIFGTSEFLMSSENNDNGIFIKKYPNNYMKLEGITENEFQLNYANSEYECMITIKRNKFGNLLHFIPNIIVTGITLGIVPLKENYRDDLQLIISEKAEVKEFIVNKKVEYNSYFTTLFFLDHWYNYETILNSIYEKEISDILIEYRQASE